MGVYDGAKYYRVKNLPCLSIIRKSIDFGYKPKVQIAIKYPFFKIFGKFSNWSRNYTSLASF